MNENTSLAKIQINKDEGEIIKQEINYVAEALTACQTSLKFKNPKKSLLEYYKYQKIK